MYMAKQIFHKNPNMLMEFFARIPKAQIFINLIIFKGGFQIF